jgi:hypothetical protein
MEEMTKRFLNWASILEECTRVQVQMTSEMPFIFPHVALMPDAHPMDDVRHEEQPRDTHQAKRTQEALARDGGSSIVSARDRTRVSGLQASQVVSLGKQFHSDREARVPHTMRRVHRQDRQRPTKGPQTSGHDSSIRPEVHTKTAVSGVFGWLLCTLRIRQMQQGAHVSPPGCRTKDLHGQPDAGQILAGSSGRTGPMRPSLLQLPHGGALRARPCTASDTRRAAARELPDSLVSSWRFGTR